jgi:hypothetical protein
VAHEPPSGDYSPSQPIGRIRCVNTVIATLGLIVGLGLFWSGRKKVNLSTFGTALISILDLAVLAVSTVLLGWIGVWVFVGTNLVAFLAASVRLAMREEEVLLYAATQCDSSKEEMYELSRWMRQEGGPFALMGPLERASLISQLAQRARQPAEMKAMVRPIALLWAVHRPEIGWLVENFDRLLRLYDMEANESMRLADVISGATKAGAATFVEMVEAMTAVAETSEPASLA